MRLGFTASALGHVMLLAGFMLANARLIDAVPTEPVTVDIVPEDELPAAAKEPPKIELPQDKTAGSAERQAAKEPAKPDPPPQRATEPRDKEAAKEPAKSQKPVEKPAPQTASALPAPAPDPFGADGAPPLYFPVMRGLDSFAANFGLDFDALADTAAKLAPEVTTALQARLQKCWHPAAGVAGADQLQAVLRVSLNRSGELIGEPVLVKASASSAGPALVETARRALRQCQPFTFLPADKYQEWKILDLSFSPRGLAGG